MTVERIDLAPGLSISRVLTGLWQVADMERDDRKIDLDAAADAMVPYVEAGLTTFDMADHYGSAEEIVGRFIARHGEGSIQVATKWVPKPGPLTHQEVRDAIERSLERLQSSTIDLLQFHSWSYDDPSYLDGLHWLGELRDEGLIRQIGLTNFDAVHLDMVLHSGFEVVSNQVSHSLIDQRASGRLFNVCRRHGVELLVYGTLAGGLLSETWVGAAEPSTDGLGTWSQMKYKRFIEAAGGWTPFQDLMQVLSAVAGRLGVSMPQLATRFVLDQKAVGGAIIGARLGESEHIAETLELFDLVIDEESRAEIEAALVRRPPVPGDCGDEYRRPPFLTAAGDLSDHIDELPIPYPVVNEDRSRRRATSGVSWEDMAGYSRAVRQGDCILVSGTTASHGDELMGGSDPGAQTHFVIDKIEGAIRSLGGSLEDVVRTRIFVSDVDHWEAVARAHGVRFDAIRPANTLVQASLIGDEYLIEMEAEAIVRGD